MTIEKAYEILQEKAYDIYNTETLWIDDVQSDFISLQGNSGTMYEELKNYRPQLKALITEYKKHFDTVWVGNYVV